MNSRIFTPNCRNFNLNENELIIRISTFPKAGFSLEINRDTHDSCIAPIKKKWDPIRSPKRKKVTSPFSHPLNLKACYLILEKISHAYVPLLVLDGIVSGGTVNKTEVVTNLDADHIHHIHTDTCSEE